MIVHRPAGERGHADHGWLDTWHTFSFADYVDPAHMGYRALRVINEDRVQAGAGFGKHPHRDMEILTWVLSGALRHGDSMGNGSTIRPGTLQRMSAGTGVVHSEVNASTTEPVHLLQIWILPERAGLDPGYEERVFEDDALAGRFALVASGDPDDDAVRIHQDARLHVTRLRAGEAAGLDLAPGRGAWLQVARGAVTVGGTRLEAGDGAAVEDERRVDVTAREDAEVLLFDLA